MLRSLQGGCSSPIGVCSTFETLKETETEDTTAEEQQQRLPRIDRGRVHLHATVLDMAGTKEIFAEDVAVVQCDIQAEQLGNPLLTCFFTKPRATYYRSQFNLLIGSIREMAEMAEMAGKMHGLLLSSCTNLYEWFTF
jgi:hydroxymethylbilane synthase